MTKIKGPIVEAQMLIRKPISLVFEAFIDPKVTSHFWFTKSSGSLVKGKNVTWEWEMYGAKAAVLVKEILPDRKIAIQWGSPATFVDFNFKALSDSKTYVVIQHYGFESKGDALTEAIKDSTAGFTTVLDGLKAYLEHGLRLNLIGDKFPKED